MAAEFNPIQLIDAKRQGEAHTRDEIRHWIDAVMMGEVPDYQLAAWLMAVCCRGLSVDETVWLTEAYVQSGTTLDFSTIKGVVVDKHSSGGVGDKTTLVLAPMLAACNLYVAKLSGRGLGFTGGTIDKLEAIPGFQTQLAAKDFIRQVQQIGIALGAQTPDLTPADGKIYALRDVTATVASIPLIAASIVSKKVAAGAQVITLDIKVGEGAFMKTLEEAKALAALCRVVGQRLGCTLSTVISTMAQPLGNAIGHTVEVLEAIETLKGRGPEDLQELCLLLGAITLVDARRVTSLEEGQQVLQNVLSSGRALEKFQQMITAQHGDCAVLTEPHRMPHPQQKIVVGSPCSGIVQACHALPLAQAVKALGGGRLTKSASIDLAVGIVLHKKTGDRVSQNEPLAEIWANQSGIEAAKRSIIEAFVFADTPPKQPILIEEIWLAHQDTPAMVSFSKPTVPLS